MTREEAIYRLNNTAWLGTNKDREETEQAVQMAIEALQEQKTGKWIKIAEGLKVTEYKCSECGRFVRDDTGYDVVKDYQFCHCGARMER